MQQHHLQLVLQLLFAFTFYAQHLMNLKPNQIIVHEQGRHVRPNDDSSLGNLSRYSVIPPHEWRIKFKKTCFSNGRRNSPSACRCFPYSCNQQFHVESAK